MKPEEIKDAVRQRYGQIAVQETSCCATTCCQEGPLPPAGSKMSRRAGYSEEELQAVPEGANLGLGCGNPTALASLWAGETVLDLGSGAGFDAFLAARQVGETGRVIGVDMTPEMIDKARQNARKGNYRNVEFQLGEIEALPLTDSSVDAIISNCVINLAPDKRKVFAEAHRVLKSGGRLMVSDLVLLRELPAFIRNSVTALTGCIAGALLKEDYLDAIRAAGFREPEVVSESACPMAQNGAPSANLAGRVGIPAWMIQKAADHYVSSVQISAVKS